MNLIPDRIAYLNSCDFSETPDFQAYLQAKVNRESWIEWARRDNTQRITGVIPPSKLYEPIPKRSFIERLLSLIP